MGYKSSAYTSHRQQSLKLGSQCEFELIHFYRHCSISRQIDSAALWMTKVVDVCICLVRKRNKLANTWQCFGDLLLLLLFLWARFQPNPSNCQQVGQSLKPTLLGQGVTRGLLRTHGHRWPRQRRGAFRNQLTSGEPAFVLSKWQSSFVYLPLQIIMLRKAWTC